MTVKKCGIHDCKRASKYFMSWQAKGRKVFGFVCSIHDRHFGRINLMAAGMTMQEAIENEEELVE